MCVRLLGFSAGTLVIGQKLLCMLNCCIGFANYDIDEIDPTHKKNK